MSKTVDVEYHIECLTTKRVFPVRAGRPQSDKKLIAFIRRATDGDIPGPFEITTLADDDPRRISWVTLGSATYQPSKFDLDAIRGGLK